ncbi:Pentatricopeptide repeat [Macleaya cordata]|uniref:Pentatricopeptide repeat n=1 Tax=Macleaya cordata TaxID=56857 RepID=A0A200PU57_MACCD|nr:Pentatricopeptide repeat [Macleaya cordata]
MRHVVFYTLGNTFFKLRLCNSPSQICTNHYQHQLFQNFKAFSILNTPVEKYPLKEIEFQYNNSIEYHHFSHLLQNCLDNGDVLSGSSIHTHLIKLNPNGFISIWNKLLNLYCKSKQIQRSLQLFEEMPQRDVVSFNTIISTSFRCNRGLFEGLKLFSKMKRENIGPNHITLSVLIGACSSTSMNLVTLVHGQAIRYGFNSDHFVGSALVDTYAKQMRLEEAICAFDEIVELDLVSWNIMIDSFVRNGCKEQALKIFSSLRNEGVEFDSFTLSSMTKTCSDSRDLNRGMEIHGCVIKAGLTSETPTSNALITMYSKCEEGMNSATKVFEGIQAPNIISWTAIIAGFMQNGQNEEAIRFYRRMLRAGMKENEFSFASILPAYSSLASLEQGMQVHARITKSRFESDISVGNALIDMYFKCGSLLDAKMVFETMANRDVVSWTVMITGFGQHGEGNEALEILKTMTSEGFKPDDVTFLGGLSACSHCGLVDEGLQIFRSMIDLYGIKPRREHLACVIDMLGRAGRLEEAEIFIEDMGLGSEAFVWEALLGACRIHGEMELGQRAAEKIMELEPKRNGPYMLLSNIYADRGLWEDKEKVRESFGLSGLKKKAGRSWVTF